MEVFNFIWISLLNEAERCNVFFSKKDIKAIFHADANFLVPENRLAYMYKYGTAHIIFMKQCIVKFLSESPFAPVVLDKILSTEKLSVCSLSLVPGFDFIGLLYGLLKSKKPVTKSVNLSLINKCDAWENVIRHMLFSSNNTVYPVAGSEVIGRFSGTFDMVIDDVITNMSVKTENCLRAADVVLMFKSFSCGNRIISLSQLLEEVLQILKPGALVLFIGNQKKVRTFVSTGSCGNFLYGPAKIRVKEVPFISKVGELIKSKPDQSANGYFAVWEKGVDLYKRNLVHPVDTSSDETDDDEQASSVSVTSAAVGNNASCKTKLFQGNFTGDVKNLKSVTVDAFNKTSDDENRSRINNSFEGVLSQVDSMVSRLEEFKNSECLKNITQYPLEDSLSSYHLHSTCLCSDNNFYYCDHPHPSVEYYGNDCAENFYIPNSCCYLNVPCMHGNNVHCQDCASRLGNHDKVLFHSIQNVPYLSVPIHKVSEENLRKIFSLISGTQ